MFAMPMSSPQIMRMLGLRPDGAVVCGDCWACATWVRSTVLIAVAAASDVPANRMLRRLRALLSDDFRGRSPDPFLVWSVTSLSLVTQDLKLHGGLTPLHVAKSDMACRRIDRFGMTRGRPITAAIIRRAQMRAAL